MNLYENIKNNIKESEDTLKSENDSEDFYNFQEKYASTINKLYDERYGTPDANTSNGKVDTTLWENLASEFYDEFKNNMNESEEDIITCEWCGNKVDVLECKKELNLGWICRDCQDTLYSRGEHAVYDEYADYYDDITSMNESDNVLYMHNPKLNKSVLYLKKKDAWYSSDEGKLPKEYKSKEDIRKGFTGGWKVINSTDKNLDKLFNELKKNKGKLVKESEDDTRIMEIIPDSGANGDYINVIIYQGNKLILDKTFYYGYDISNSEEMERIAHRDYERSIEYNWNEPYYYKEKPYTPKLIKKLMDEYNISSNNVILRPAENTSWHPKNYSSNSHIEITKEMLKDLNINQEVEPSFHDSIIVKENPDKSIYIKDLHGNELTFENVEDAIKNFEKDFDIISTKDNDRTKIAEHKMNGYILSNLWAIKKEARGDN